MFFSKAKGILGMNARNLLYVARHNTKADKRFADDKIYTKQFLSSRGIGIAKLYTVIRTHQELKHFQVDQLPASCVIKPNHGFGGEGIMVVTGKDGDTVMGVGGKKWGWGEMYRNMIAILDGKYAISGLRDEIIIEERLITHDYFRPYCRVGLPDVRVIVFNLVPVIAMLRLPTQESEGKANLHLGAVGLGIDLGTGKTTYGVQHGDYVTRLPSGDRVNSLTLPDWDDLMLTAAKCQKVSDIGYLAVDLAITTRGIKVLELNARAGLSVQIANRVFLRSRLEKVADIKVLTPEKGVEVAQTLFATNQQLPNTRQDAPVVGAFETVRLANAKPEMVVAKMDPHAGETIIDESIAVQDDEKLLYINIGEEKIVTPYRRQALPKDEYQILIAGRHLRGFLIDASADRPTVPAVHHSARDEKIVANIDKKLFELAAGIHFLARLKPINLEQMKELFLKSPTASPVFSYKPLDLDIEGIRKELGKLPRDFEHPLKELYLAKMDELETRLSLIERRGSPDIMPYSIQLYGDVSVSEFEAARAAVRQTRVEEDESPMLNVEQVVTRLQELFERIKLSGWKITVQEESVADMQIVKSGSVLLNRRARITENRLKSQIAHEIETHVFRQENGKRQPLLILEQGTAKYLETEEGLAIFNQNAQHVAVGEKALWAAWRTIAIWHGREMGFWDLFHYMKREYGLGDESAWHTCLKVKRGLSDTDQPGVFTKDHLYFSGYEKVRRFYEKEGREGFRKLYIGKIRIEDLPLLDRVKDTIEWKVKYLPEWMNAG